MIIHLGPESSFLYAISDLESPSDSQGFLERAAALAAAGLGAIQIRQKTWDDCDVVELARAARRALPSSIAVLVNRRFDLALAAGAQGVHLPADGVSVTEVRSHVPPGFLIFVSTHSLSEVERAAEDRADAATFGPVFDSPSKRSFGSPLGLASLERAAKYRIPVIALGGVDLLNAADCFRAGAAGIAAIRMFLGPNAPSPEQIVESLRPADREIPRANR